jgi:hypothetical protein
MMQDEFMAIGVFLVHDDQSPLDVTSFPSVYLLAKLSSSYLLKCCMNHPI